MESRKRREKIKKQELPTTQWRKDGWTNDWRGSPFPSSTHPSAHSSNSCIHQSIRARLRRGLVDCTPTRPTRAHPYAPSVCSAAGGCRYACGWYTGRAAWQTIKTVTGRGKQYWKTGMIRAGYEVDRERRNGTSDGLKDICLRNLAIRKRCRWQFNRGCGHG